MTEQDYRRLFERVEPAPALVERTLSAAGARPRRRHPVRRAAALVVAGALLAGLSASFAAVKPVSPNVVTLETWTASGLGVPIGESDSDLGWTVSVDGVASDRWYAYILCIMALDSSTLDWRAVWTGARHFNGWRTVIPPTTKFPSPFISTIRTAGI